MLLQASKVVEPLQRLLELSQEGIGTQNPQILNPAVREAQTGVVPLWTKADNFHCKCPLFSVIKRYTCLCYCCIPGCTATDTPHKSFGPICIICTVTGNISLALHQIAWRCTRVQCVMLHHTACYNCCDMGVLKGLDIALRMLHPLAETLWKDYGWCNCTK